jgi:hypothetical protein
MFSLLTWGYPSDLGLKFVVLLAFEFLCVRLEDLKRRLARVRGEKTYLHTCARCVI